MSYWVGLRRDGLRVGAGFLVTRRHVVTAAHCAGGGGDLVAEFDDGFAVAAAVAEVVKGADLALLRLDGLAPTRPARLGRAAAGDQWRAPARPMSTDPRLSGQVVEPALQYECVAGEQLEVLQLRCDVELGTYRGYSGGPVESRSAVVGLLLEQYPDRQDPERFAGVLFAATTAEIFRRFECLRGPSPTEDVLADAGDVLRQGRDWLEQGLISPSALEVLQVRVARSVVDQTIGRSAP
ncbi:trypsin-like peptidase domain-containing protein [Actinokineospora sp. NPDC004072]